MRRFTTFFTLILLQCHRHPPNPAHLDTVEAEGAERLSEILRDPAVQGAIARGVNQAIVDFLRRPVRTVLGEPDATNLVTARDTLTGWVVGMARDPASHDCLSEKLRSGLEKAGARTWGDVLERVPPDRIAASISPSSACSCIAMTGTSGLKRSFCLTTCRIESL